MSAATATRTPGLPETYYAPEFRVEVEKKALDPASRADVLEVKVVMDIDALASVDLKLNNYDDTTFDLKWSESDLFRLGNSVHVQLGYADRLVSVLRGKITTLSAEFPSDGPPTLTVRAMDGLVVLKGSHPPATEVVYRKKRDWQIAEQVARRHNLRFSHDKDDPGPIRDRVVQHEDDDLVFLKKRAAMIDRQVFMRTDPKTGDDVLHFGPPSDGRGKAPIRTYTLAWGSLRNTSTAPSMIEFKPTISASDQVQSVTVRGWDVEAKKEFTHTATAADTPGVSGSGDTTGPAAARTVAGAQGKLEVVVNARVANQEEAKDLAERLLARRAYAFLTATARIIGLPDIRPGDNVEIAGAGKTFSGTYYVTQATHILNASGLITELTVRKTYVGAKK